MTRGVSLQFTANRCLLVLPTDTGDEGATVAVGLRREHDVAMNSLFYGASRTFDGVIERFHSCAELLNSGR
jgi:hypothetical protein